MEHGAEGGGTAEALAELVGDVAAGQVWEDEDVCPSCHITEWKVFGGLHRIHCGIGLHLAINLDVRTELLDELLGSVRPGGHLLLVEQEDQIRMEQVASQVRVDLENLLYLMVVELLR